MYEMHIEPFIRMYVDFHDRQITLICKSMQSGIALNILPSESCLQCCLVATYDFDYSIYNIVSFVEHRAVLPTWLPIYSFVWYKKHKNRINLMEVRFLRRKCRIKLSNKVKNIAKRVRCGMKPLSSHHILIW